jgi:4'-phosphopantetheinyl transferase
MGGVMIRAFNAAGSDHTKFGESLLLQDDGVQVWWASLDVPEADIHRLVSVLSSEERMRAERYFFKRDRKRYVAARAFLRTIVGRHLKCTSEEVLFRYGPDGKPEVMPPPGRPPMHVNTSHAGDVVLIATSEVRPVGVDIEQIRPLQDIERLAANVLSPLEWETWHALPEDQRRRAFFHAWTRKEAVLKAIGVGLTHSLHRIEVTLIPGQPAQLLRRDGAERHACGWILRDLSPAAGYVGTLAYES